MSLSENLRQCRIVIREVAQGETIADTIIIAHDIESGKIEIETDVFNVEEGSVISALVFSKSGLFETQGTVGIREGNKSAIVLYEGSDKDDRHAVRYQVNINGTVDMITRQNEKISENFDITILNMSSIGLLAQAPAGRIKDEDNIRFAAVTKGQRIIITAHVERVETCENGKENVGCTVQLVNLG